MLTADTELQATPFKILGTVGVAVTPPAGKMFVALVPIGYGVTCKAQSNIGGDDFATTGIYSSGSYLDLARVDRGQYKSVTVGAGNVKAYYR